MKLYKEAAQPGNNILSKKSYRVTVPLINEINPSAVIQGKYFFPENKTLTNVQINGVQLHFGGFDITAKGNQSFANVTLLNAGPLGLNVNAFITMYDHEGIEIFYNTPVYHWYNAKAGAGSFSKIIPLNCKLNLRKSYILVPQPYTTIFPFVPAYTMTFFYD